MVVYQNMKAVFVNLSIARIKLTTIPIGGSVENDTAGKRRKESPAAWKKLLQRLKDSIHQTGWKEVWITRICKSTPLPPVMKNSRTALFKQCVYERSDIQKVMNYLKMQVEEG